MNVLLFRATTEETREAIAKGAAGLAGQPVRAGGRKTGVVRRAWTDDTEHGLELWAELELEEAFLPHELDLGRLSIEGGA